MAPRKNDPLKSPLLLRAKNTELAAYKAYLETILQSVSDSLVVINPDATVKMVNRGTLDLLGYSEDELISRPVNIFSPEETLFKGAKWWKLLREGSVRNYNMIYRAKAGEDIPVNFSGSVMRDKLGNIIGLVGIARDMRELLRLEREERERTKQLESALQNLMRAQSQLVQSEKMAAVGQLAAGVAHEINNPLGVILGFSQSLIHRIKEEDPFALPLQSIQREAKRCKNLVQDMLTFSRVGKMEKELCDLNEVIQTALSLIEAQTKVKSIAVIKNLEKNIGKVMIQRNQIQQVIINLCSNAMDAMPNGGTLTVATRLLGTLAVPLDKGERKWVEISVSDTGTGIPQEIQSKIFEPFFTTKEIGKGTGLGLSLVYEIVRRHDGAIQAESEVGKGATFIITIPASAPAGEARIQ